MIKVEWKPQAAIAWLEQLSEKALDEASRYLLSKYLEYAPEDTGYLKSTGEIVVISQGSWHRVMVTAIYAAAVEFGHVMPQGGYVPPNPALARAVEDTARMFPQFFITQGSYLT